MQKAFIIPIRASVKLVSKWGELCIIALSISSLSLCVCVCVCVCVFLCLGFACYGDDGVKLTPTEFANECV
jgi:hypothetical protein